MSREYILLNDFLSINITKNDNKQSEKNNKNSFYFECENIIDEYLLMNNSEELKYFIETKCLDAINKNILCEVLIEKYFNENNDNNRELIQLIKSLISSQHLFKNNISKGLQLFYNSWNDKMIDYDNPNNKMKLLLNTLKTLNIKNIDYIFNNFLN